MISTRALNSLRAAQRRGMPDRCTVQRPTVTIDSAGNPVETWADLATDVPCRMTAYTYRSGTEQLIVGQVKSPTPYQITLPFDQEVDPRDRLIIGSRSFEISQVMVQGAWTVAKYAVVVEIV